MNNNTFRFFHSLIFLLCVLITLFAVQYFQSSSEEVEEPSRKLTFSATLGSNDGYAVLMKEHGRHTGLNIDFAGCEDVTVEVDETMIPFESAVRNAQLSFQEVWMYAHEDAEGGFCTIKHKCKNGLTSFCFQYPELDLWLTDDILVTPDGNHHQIRDITLCAPEKEFGFVFIDDESADRIDWEDWGIQFTVSEVTPTGITLSYIQSSNQVIGQLFATRFEVYKRDPVSELIHTGEEPFENALIVSNTESKISISWEGRYGVLPYGNYVLYLYLEDIYGEIDISPLVNNFHDTQVYSVNFTVPDL